MPCKIITIRIPKAQLEPKEVGNLKRPQRGARIDSLEPSTGAGQQWWTWGDPEEGQRRFLPLVIRGGDDGPSSGLHGSQGEL